MPLGQVELRRRFGYWPPDTEEKVSRHEAVRHLIHATAAALDELLPDGREKSLAFTALEQVGFNSHAAVARPPAEPTDPGRVTVVPG